VELSRFYRALRDRWILVVVLGLVGLATAATLSSLKGAEEPRLQAIAPIQFQIATDESGDLEGELAAAVISGELAAQEIIAQDPNDRFVTSDPIAGELLFAAVENTGPIAIETATTMRQAYLDVDPLAGGANVDERLAQVEEEAGRFNDELASLAPANDPSIEQHLFIESQQTQLRQRLLDIAVLRVTADTETKAVYDTEQSQIEEALDQLAVQKAALPPLQAANPSIAFRQQAIQQRLDVLAVEYSRLYLRKSGVTTGGTNLAIRLVDLTPPAPSLVINGLLGLVVGLGLAGLAISVDGRFRRPVWVADDISLPVLGEIPYRRFQFEPGKIWYDQERRHPRKHAIQALRAAVEGRLPGRPHSIAIGGINSGSAMVQAVTIDLGVSFASAGWSVLIVDAELDPGEPAAELKGTGPTLTQVLNRRSADPAAQRQLAIDAVEEATVVRRNVSFISAGIGTDSSADALSGVDFQVFLEEASSRFDLVLMVSGDLINPAGQVLLQRLDYGIVCLVPGRTSSDIVEDLVEELGDRGVLFVGAVFLHRRGAAMRRTFESDRSLDGMSVPERKTLAREQAQARGPSRTELEVAPSPLGGGAGGRTQRRPIAPPGRTAKIGDGPGVAPRPRIGSFVDETRASALRGRLMRALEDVEAESYENVARFMVDTVTALMTDPVNKSDFTNDAMTAAQAGFLPLHEVKGHQSVGAVLVSEFRSHLGAKLGTWLATEAEWVLSEGFGASGYTLTLDEWLANEYFDRHIKASGYEPAVWHLTSRHKTVQVLVDAARLSRDCIDDLRGTIVERAIGTLERNLKSAVRTGKADAVEQLGEQLSDARTFEIALGWLYEGTTPNARLVYPSRLPDQQPHGWNPVWTEGVKPNIAPLQRLGLLAVPVLTKEELQSLRPTG